ncbi:MAG: endo-1,4-beta-xylanase [Tannerella sp.]|jgi:GH35 family endo-1,4-beta-xylanase|nr:endo-1,4-beta-xylanase [Tannerella sp.]
MKTIFTTLFMAVIAIQLAAQQDNVMSEAYWKIWSGDVQAKIDRDIDLYRKADAVVTFDNIPPGTEVKIEQVSHDFIFGAHIFNFNQLGTYERNRKYKELYGTLFNSATISFYWKKFEMQPNRPRFREEYWDTEEYWNQAKEPKNESHWRRPASDPVVEFCESKGIRMHGHNIIWGNNRWQYPEWLYETYCPDGEKEKLAKYKWDELKKLTPGEIAAMAPVYCRNISQMFEKRVKELAGYYGGRLHSWDVVNESAVDFHGNSYTGEPVNISAYKQLMAGDYVYKAFQQAGVAFPKHVQLNINDYANNENYTNQVKDLLKLGCRIDIMGSQMHLFDPQQCLDIAAGKQINKSGLVWPDGVWNTMAILSKADRPIHLSEITITAPGDDERGRAIQAVIARNLYRLWFSIEKMMGITWWNVVDDCGAPGEPTTSGLFTRNMEPKPSYFALDKLINEEWKTVLDIKTEAGKAVRFRGFKGKYKISWKDKSGDENTAYFYLKEDGDGIPIR